MHCTSALLQITYSFPLTPSNLTFSLLSLYASCLGEHQWEITGGGNKTEVA